MEKLLDDLLSLKSEGVWWDFKLKFHDDLFDLLHDITCLANVIHDGDRFLIFGINDALEVVGLDVEELRFSQADVISYLRQQPYAEHNIPKIDIKFLKYSILFLETGTFISVLSMIKYCFLSIFLFKEKILSMFTI